MLGRIVAIEEEKVRCLLDPSLLCAREKRNTYVGVSHCDAVVATKKKELKRRNEVVISLRINGCGVAPPERGLNVFFFYPRTTPWAWAMK